MTKNMMKFGNYHAVISYDPEIEMFRGEFVNLNGGADFYASTVEGLREEGHKSLDIFLEECQKAGIEPVKHYSGKFMVRVSSKVHEAAALLAASEGKSLNQLAEDALLAAIADSDEKYALAA
ncbi:MAG TPA: toxin-antitoxin system HicB family antitoxin [Comamonadaceae bacterium]|nr:toxin-antitoxin system HicB family antitoxin [Comamonadaceae bacterium]